jgi:hypothetical protein
MPGPQVAKLKKMQANVNEDAIPKGRENRNCVSLGEVESRGVWDTGGEDVWTDCCLGTFRWR